MFRGTYVHVYSENRASCVFFAYSYLFFSHCMFACVGYAFPGHSNYQRYVRTCMNLHICLYVHVVGTMYVHVWTCMSAYTCMYM